MLLWVLLHRVLTALNSSGPAKPVLCLGANFVLVTGVLCVIQAGLGAGAVYLGWAAQGDPGLSSGCCLQEGEACTALSLSPGSVTSANITLGSSFGLFLKEKQIQAEEPELQYPGTLGITAPIQLQLQRG